MEKWKRGNMHCERENMEIGKDRERRLGTLSLSLYLHAFPLFHFSRRTASSTAVIEKNHGKDTTRKS
jgi:hypothetical protein